MSTLSQTSLPDIKLSKPQTKLLWLTTCVCELNKSARSSKCGVRNTTLVLLIESHVLKRHACPWVCEAAEGGGNLTRTVNLVSPRGDLLLCRAEAEEQLKRCAKDNSCMSASRRVSLRIISAYDQLCHWRDSANQSELNITLFCFIHNYHQLYFSVTKQVEMLLLCRTRTFPCNYTLAGWCALNCFVRFFKGQWVSGVFSVCRAQKNNTGCHG